MNLLKSFKKFLKLIFETFNVINAARRFKLQCKENLKLSLEIKNNIIKITSNKAIFGPSPFLAINELLNLFYRDNPTKESEKLWIYKIPMQ